MLIVRDWMGHRGPFVLLCITWNVIAYPCLRTTSWDTSRWHRYGVIAVANVSYISMQYVLSVPDVNGVLTSQCSERRLAVSLLQTTPGTERCHGVSPIPYPIQLNRYSIRIDSNYGSVIVMAANCAGISGSQIFRTSDMPRYTHGLTAICALAAASWVFALVLNLYYFWRAKKQPPSLHT